MTEFVNSFFLFFCCNILTLSVFKAHKRRVVILTLLSDLRFLTLIFKTEEMRKTACNLFYGFINHTFSSFRYFRALKKSHPSVFFLNGAVGTVVGIMTITKTVIALLIRDIIPQTKSDIKYKLEVPHRFRSHTSYAQQINSFFNSYSDISALLFILYENYYEI